LPKIGNGFPKIGNEFPKIGNISGIAGHFQLETCSNYKERICCRVANKYKYFKKETISSYILNDAFTNKLRNKFRLKHPLNSGFESGGGIEGVFA